MHFAEGVDVGVGAEDVVGGDDVLVAVTFGDGFAVRVVASYYQDCLVVVLFHLCEGCVRLHDHVLAQWDLEFLLEIGDSGCFGFAAAIGQEDEGDLLVLEI